MSKKDRQPIGLVLLNLGGPESLESVEPFLVNLFSDPDILPLPWGNFLRSFLARLIARRRSEKVKGYYRKIGGGSPILSLTQGQARGLEQQLNQWGHFKVFIAMRYWHPLTEQTVGEMIKDGFKKIILLPLYPQYSTATTESSFIEFDRVYEEMQIEKWEVLKISSWYSHPSYIHALSLQITETIGKIPTLKEYPLHIVFSAHGVPLRLIQKGDPYQKQVEENIRLVKEALAMSHPTHLCYQSKVGPLKWTSPSTIEMLETLAKQGVKQILMVPISFVSDHSETLYEMDILYKELADKLGILYFYRLPSFNDSPPFLKALSDIVQQACKEKSWS